MLQGSKSIEPATALLLYTPGLNFSLASLGSSCVPRSRFSQMGARHSRDRTRRQVYWTRMTRAGTGRLTGISGW